MKIRTLIFNMEFVSGFILAFSFTIFHEAFYIGYIVFMCSLLNFDKEKWNNFFKTKLLLFIALCIIIVFSNFQHLFTTFMPLPAMINLTMILSLVFYPVLVKSPESVFRGFYTGCSILSVFVIFFFIVKGYYLSPLQIMVKERNWGEDIFPFWGNGFAVVLALSSLMLLAQRHYLLWAVNILAAVLTTSRTPFIALIISLLVIFMQNKHIRIRIILIVFVLISLNTGIKYYMDLEYSESMIARLEKTEDREVVLGENMNAFKDNWLFGIGNIKYGEYLHAHNVFLQIMSRNGIIALALYLLLILPAKKALGLQYKYVAAIVFLWIASFVQVALMACHIIMLYSLMTMHPKFLTINKIKK